MSKDEYAELWQGDTGVMNVIQIPGTEQLLAITRFYPIFQSREAAICLLTPPADGYMKPWTIREVALLPFCHRIGVVESRNGLFLLGCQLCHDKRPTRRTGPSLARSGRPRSRRRTTASPGS